MTYTIAHPLDRDLWITSRTRTPRPWRIRGVTMAIRQWVTLTLVLLTVTMVMPFIWHNKLQPEETGNQKADVVEDQLQRVIRSLDRANSRMVEMGAQRRKRTEHIVLHQMAAVAQNNTLPNYFLQRPEAAGPEPYRQGALVFLHHPRAAGSAVVSCLDAMARNRSLASSPVMDSDQRLLWDAEGEVSGATLRTNRDRLALHRGRFAFGICGDLTRKCSHFTLLRDPMSRAVSSFRYCQSAYGDEMCRVVNANKLTLREWVLHQGSVLYRQLLFRSHPCHLVADAQNDSSTDSSPYRGWDEHRKSAADPDHVPCWYRHKLQMDAEPPDLRRHLVDYVVTNLGRWFAVIGLYEELGPSLEMFEHVYGMPFTQCENFRNTAPQNAEIFDNRSNRKKRRRSTEDDLDNDPEYIKYDYEVREALDADYRIYREAQKLFRIQRQVLLNKIAR